MSEERIRGGYRVNSTTGEVLSWEGQRYEDDPPEVVFHPQANLGVAIDGLSFDGEQVVAQPHPKVARATKTALAHEEASRRRQGVLESTGAGHLADFLSLTAQAVAGVRRESKGRPNPGEVTRLDQLEALADQIEAIDNARNTIISEIRMAADPARYDVVNSPHWPVDPEEPNP